MSVYPEQEKARADAATLLNARWRHDGKLELPVDPIVIARRLDIDVRLVPMDPQASGALVLNAVAEDDVEKTILINEGHFPVRQRFSCAHELGHYYEMISNQRALTGTHVEWRDHRAATGTDPRERYANAFAAALLMPVELLAETNAREDPAGAGSKLWVSPEALRLRLRSVNV